MVDAHDDRQIGAVGRGRDDNLLGAGFEVLCRRVALCKNTGAFERHVDAELAPRQFRRVALGGDADLATADVHPIVAARHLTREAAVHAVEPQQMRIGLDRPEIVDADDLNLAVLVLVSRAQDKAADAAESVDCNPYRHDPTLRNRRLSLEATPPPSQVGSRTRLNANAHRAGSIHQIAFAPKQRSWSRRRRQPATASAAASRRKGYTRSPRTRRHRCRLSRSRDATGRRPRRRGARRETTRAPRCRQDGPYAFATAGLAALGRTAAAHDIRL